MPLTVAQQELYDWIRSAVPEWLFQKDTATQEYFQSVAVAADSVRTVLDDWVRSTYLGLGTAGVWLDKHAGDRGTSRQASESDDALRVRLRTPSDAVTEPALESAADDILTALGLTTGVKIVSLRMDRAFFWTDPATTRKHAYLSRGYRMGVDGVARSSGSGSYNVQPTKIIAILPYGTTVNAQNAIGEMLRTRKAGGFEHVIEVRANP